MTRQLVYSALASAALLLANACSSTTVPVTVGAERPAITFVGEDEAGNARFALTNDTASAWTFHGYEASPIYSVEFRTADGWEPRILGWCGTGLGEQVLPPGATLTFVAALEPDEASRVLVSLVAEDGTEAVIVSPVVGGA